jgi:hypothetical protein
MSVDPNIPTPLGAELTESVEVIEHSFAEALAFKPIPPRAINHVAAHLADILAARAQGHTWDTLAGLLGLRRCTLINAVKTLKARNPFSDAGPTWQDGAEDKQAEPKREQFIPSTRPAVSLSQPPINSAKPKTTDTPTKLISLGRTNPKNFNL